MTNFEAATVIERVVGLGMAVDDTIATGAIFVADANPIDTVRVFRFIACAARGVKQPVAIVMVHSTSRAKTAVAAVRVIVAELPVPEPPPVKVVVPHADVVAIPDGAFAITQSGSFKAIVSPTSNGVLHLKV